MEVKDKIVRPEIVAALVERDGTICKHPSCGKKIDMTLTEGPYMPTIDHSEPQSWCYANGWTRAQVWDMSNLTLMHRKCNADKGDRRYREDGTLPPKATSRFRYRREKRAGRPELCTVCNNGHNLTVGEVCATCGCNAQRFPMEAKMKYNECDHAIFWCWSCSIGVTPRPAAVDMAVIQGESGEWDDEG